jgi:hypothetical protein
VLSHTGVCLSHYPRKSPVKARQKADTITRQVNFLVLSRPRRDKRKRKTGVMAGFALFAF